MPIQHCSFNVDRNIHITISVTEIVCLLCYSFTSTSGKLYSYLELETCLLHSILFTLTTHKAKGHPFQLQNACFSGSLFFNFSTIFFFLGSCNLPGILSFPFIFILRFPFPFGTNKNSNTLHRLSVWGNLIKH